MTRSLAARACELGRIESNRQVAEEAREVRVGDVLQVRNDSGIFPAEILVLSKMRGPAETHGRSTVRQRRAGRCD